MKSYAIAINKFTGDESTISAFDAFLLREENNSEYKKLTLYYGVIDDEYKVFPRFNKSTQRAHFVFYTKNDNSIQSDSEGESLTHYVAKTALANLSTLHLVNKKNNIDLYLNVTKGESEKIFDFSEQFRADVYYEFSKNQISKIGKRCFYKWYGKLVIEVVVTHKTNYNKYRTFEENGIPIFEVSISKTLRDKLKLDKPGIPLTQERKNMAIIEMKNIFSRNIYGKFISNPSSEEYVIMSQYKEEIVKLKTTYQQNLEKLNRLRSEIDIKEKKVEELESKIAFYNDLENKIYCLSEENKRLSKNVTKLEEENHTQRQRINDFNKHPIKEIFKAIKKGNRKHDFKE